MKVAINGVEYNVWNIDDFLNVQKVLNGCFSKLMKNQAKEEAADEMRTQIIEEYWNEAKRGNSDVQREIYEGVVDTPALYDKVIEDALHDTDYSSIDEVTEYISRMEEAMDDIYSIAEDYR